MQNIGNTYHFDQVWNCCWWNYWSKKVSEGTWCEWVYTYTDKAWQVQTSQPGKQISFEMSNEQLVSGAGTAVGAGQIQRNVQTTYCWGCIDCCTQKDYFTTKLNKQVVSNSYLPWCPVYLWPCCIKYPVKNAEDVLLGTLIPKTKCCCCPYMLVTNPADQDIYTITPQCCFCCTQLFEVKNLITNETSQFQKKKKCMCFGPTELFTKLHQNFNNVDRVLLLSSIPYL